MVFRVQRWHQEMVVTDYAEGKDPLLTRYNSQKKSSGLCKDFCRALVTGKGMSQ